MTRTTGGRLATITYAPGRTVAYEYDGLGHVTRMLDWLGKSITFRYDAAGRMTNILRPNGRGTVLSYDAEDRILQVVHANLGSLTLTRDPEGRIRQAIRDLPLPPPPLQATSTNRYDAAHQEIGSTYDALGRLVASGNRTYRWDLASRLLECTTAGSRFEFTYDAFGQRLSRTSSAGTEHFVWNYDMGLPSLLIQRDGAGTDPWYYLYTPGGQLLQSINAVSGEAYFYHFDEQGNTLWLTDQAGDVAARYLYAPYGELLAAAGDHPNPFRFQGRYGVMHDPTGLSYCRARYLDPDTGRFLSPDPLRGTLPKSANPYPYGLNNPLRYQDPLGLQAVSVEPPGPEGTSPASALESANTKVAGESGEPPDEFTTRIRSATTVIFLPERLWKAEVQATKQKLRDRVAKAEWGRFDPDIPATFDSRFLRHQDRLFHFRGKIMNGGELNYYFQGMYWKELGVRRVASATVRERTTGIRVAWAPWLNPPTWNGPGTDSRRRI